MGNKEEEVRCLLTCFLLLPKKRDGTVSSLEIVVGRCQYDAVSAPAAGKQDVCERQLWVTDVCLLQK